MAPYSFQGGAKEGHATVIPSRADSGQIADFADKILLQHIALARILCGRVFAHDRKAHTSHRANSMSEINGEAGFALIDRALSGYPR
jgi:hypothetical protein